MLPTWGPPGSCRPQVDPMLAPWTLLSGYTFIYPQVIRCWAGVTLMRHWWLVWRRWHMACDLLGREHIERTNTAHPMCVRAAAWGHPDLDLADPEKSLVEAGWLWGSEDSCSSSVKVWGPWVASPSTADKDGWHRVCWVVVPPVTMVEGSHGRVGWERHESGRKGVVRDWHHIVPVRVSSSRLTSCSAWGCSFWRAGVWRSWRASGLRARGHKAWPHEGRPGPSWDHAFAAVRESWSWGGGPATHLPSDSLWHRPYPLDDGGWVLGKFRTACVLWGPIQTWRNCVENWDIPRPSDCTGLRPQSWRRSLRGETSSSSDQVWHQWPGAKVLRLLQIKPKSFGDLGTSRNTQSNKWSAQ